MEGPSPSVAGSSQLSSMALNSSKKLALGLGVASVAAGAGSVAVQAGPALQTLNNITNTAEFTINNTYGQSFSVDGELENVTVGTAVITSITPFAGAATAVSAQFNATSATLTTGFDGAAFGAGGFQPVDTINAEATLGVIAPLTLNDTAATTAVQVAGLTDIRLTVGTATQTIGASISSTVFGASTVKGTTSYTNQLINDLSAF